jgi:hypothetical protein
MIKQPIGTWLGPPNNDTTDYGVHRCPKSGTAAAYVERSDTKHAGNRIE